jgi:hypothetical protein
MKRIIRLGHMGPRTLGVLGLFGILGILGILGSLGSLGRVFLPSSPRYFIMPMRRCGKDESQPGKRRIGRESLAQSQYAWAVNRD